MLLWYGTATTTGGRAGLGSNGSHIGMVVTRPSTPMGSLLTEPLLTRMRPYIAPRQPARLADAIAYDQVSRSLEVITFGLLGAVVCRFLARRVDRSHS